jgi:ankyrin repeat protein
MSKQYITILTKDLKYKEYQWKYGLNEIEHFNIEKEYTASPEGNEKELFNTESDESKANTKVDVTDALYVCEIKDFFKMMPLHPNIAYVGYVTIPEDAQIIRMEYKIKTNKVILNKQLNNLIDFIYIAIKSGADINTNINDFFNWASEYGYLDIVEYLINHGADIHTWNDFAVRYASLNGHLEVVKCLVSRGANIHTFNDEAFCRAARNGHLPIVEYLIAHGADIHADNDKALRYASLNGHKEVVEWLIKNGSDSATPNLPSRNALSVAANQISLTN